MPGFAAPSLSTVGLLSGAERLANGLVQPTAQIVARCTRDLALLARPHSKSALNDSAGLLHQFSKASTIEPEHATQTIERQ